MSKVFGIGWAKTGTTTLGECFKTLGLNHQSQRLDLVLDLAKNDLSRILELAKEKDSFEDWPWIILYQELDEAFPGSRFILTQRDSKNWLLSYQNMIQKKRQVSEKLNAIRRILYSLPFPDVSERDLVERYNQHNEEIMLYFQDRPDDLLVVDWEKGDGWETLCQFLGKEIPDAPFPHKNKGTYQPEEKKLGVFDVMKGWLK